MFISPSDAASRSPWRPGQAAAPRTAAGGAEAPHSEPTTGTRLTPRIAVNTLLSGPANGRPENQNQQRAKTKVSRSRNPDSAVRITQERPFGYSRDSTPPLQAAHPGRVQTCRQPLHRPGAGPDQADGAGARRCRRPAPRHAGQALPGQPHPRRDFEDDEPGRGIEKIRIIE